MISHANLAHNLSCIVEELKAGKIQSLYLASQYLMIWTYWQLFGLPLLWWIWILHVALRLREAAFALAATCVKISRTHLQAPNFAYARAKIPSLKKPRPSICLASVAVNTAEPVMEKDLRAFNLSTFGLNDGVVFPTYIS